GADGALSADEWIAVATTRPETIFGDTAVAVHPDDDRYRGIVGREAVIPFIGRRVPIIADEHVERDFGTGAVKITPAHDFDDYEVGQRHGLPMITVLDPDARLTDEAGQFAGLDRHEARPRIVDALRTAGDLEGEQPHEMVIGRCDRCGTVVEPILSVQWFIRAGPLADRALASLREGRLRIMPSHFEKVYTHWMENIRDWAVGRQLWWGHRIPAWYCPDGHITVTDLVDGPIACEACGRPAAELLQETDIFDTWFSSGLWPFSTLGWPDDTADLRRFYPGDVLETAYEILFFWVARMVMLGLFLTDEEPFHTVYLHGIVRDPTGSKMSKTKGNVVDPLEMVADIGADALRVALVSGNAPGVDQRLTPSKMTGGRNFTNKLWNAARFVLGSQPPPAAEQASGSDETLAGRWIRSRLADATERATRQLDALDIAGYAATVHELAWSDFCDWYLEMAKLDLRREDADPQARAATWGTAAEALGTVLRLLHPLMPFVTEEIWSALGDAHPAASAGEPLLIRARWPQPAATDPDAEGEFEDLSGLIRAVRNLRTDAGVAAGRWVPLHVRATDGPAMAALTAGRSYVESLARVRPIEITEAGQPPDMVATSAFGPAWIEVAAPTTDAGTIERRAARLEDLAANIERVRNLLANGAFIARAPEAVVARERERLAELELEHRQLTAS
ncbi:MAG: valine--tRNA ligase, partial [Chloroflexi bacterium]|nr:valine--tRNA ligase [Chloroflexota bacterium]